MESFTDFPVIPKVAWRQ